MKTTKATKRMQFIEGIKAKIVEGVPVGIGDEAQVRAAIARYEAGERPRDPFESGVFAMCEQIQKQIERT